MTAAVEEAAHAAAEATSLVLERFGNKMSVFAWELESGIS